jgi:hypothetical protein
MVSVPPLPGWIPARGIMEHLLATKVSLPGSPLSVGQATVILFLYSLLTLTCGPDTILSELKLASLTLTHGPDTILSELKLASL